MAVPFLLVNNNNTKYSFIMLSVNQSITDVIDKKKDLMKSLSLIRFVDYFEKREVKGESWHNQPL
jgi:hypothetical protein